MTTAKHQPIGTTFDPEVAGWAITVAARVVPWRSDCLVQAMAAANWLRRNGHNPIFHLGVARSEQGELTGHAWLTLNGRPITGEAAASGDPFVPILSSHEAEFAQSHREDPDGHLDIRDLASPSHATRRARARYR